ncbi:MAG: hypothetical protein ACLPLP_11100 [Mycobacterium sp.]
MPDVWSDELVVAHLGEIVHARSGDKGGDANLVVWARNPQGWGSLPDTRELAIERYELPNLVAVNFLIRGLLGTAQHRHCGWTRKPRHLAKRSAGTVGRGLM